MSTALVKIALVAAFIGVPLGPKTGVIQSVADSGAEATLSAPSRSVSGRASWYRYVRGQAAAGPALRRALGARWRGARVYVNGIPVILTDWCQCYRGEARERLIDLDVRTFDLIVDRTLGIAPVRVTW